jgi:hypothetical protein
MRLLLAMAALMLVLAAPADAARRSAWQRVLRDHNVRATAGGIIVRPGHFGRATVSVRLQARGSNDDPVLFPDTFYGATAWRWTGRRWRRADTARARPALVRELAPGRRVRVRLPVRRHPRRLRVLVPVTADHAGAWTDVIR